jgi:putative ABC transport system substrate-binding protein
MMRRRQFLTLLGGTVAWPLAAIAQVSERVRRVGVLMPFAEDDADTKARLTGFRSELERLGWSDGRNVRIDYRFAPAGVEAPKFAKELIALRPDVILAVSTPITTALQRETRTVPIVFVGITADPVSSGFVPSLARPSGNLTGVVMFEPTVTGKWLAMLREIAPRLSRAALVFNPKTAAYHDYYFRAGEAAASSLAVEFVPLAIEDATADIERAIGAFAQVPNGGLVMLPDTTNDVHRDLLITLAAKHRLPAVYSNRLYVLSGGLMCYSTDRVDQFRQVASYIDRILRGAKPADLPVQTPTKYKTVLNIKTAKALGLTVPPGLLVAADEVIE